MSKSNFMFLALLLSLVSVHFFTEWLTFNVQLVISGFAISLLGIPHGAIDHIIFRKKNKVSAFRFYTNYIGLMLVYLLFWMFLPKLSMAGFMILSAFHFGQSQFYKYPIVNNFFKKIIYFTWGFSLLSGLIVLNGNEIIQITSQNKDLSVFICESNISFYQNIFLISNIAFLVICLILAVSKKITEWDILKEISILILIQLSFYFLPVLIGFTVYFCTLHAVQVMSDEFDFLKKKMAVLTGLEFVKLLLPYTLLSIIGILFLLLLVSFQIISVSVTLLIFIVISILTLPHSIVMDNFYSIEMV
jgi:beta-carotene 15,15'-dioxygenase